MMPGAFALCSALSEGLACSRFPRQLGASTAASAPLCSVNLLITSAHFGRCWVNHVNAARADAVAGAGWRAVAAQLTAAIRAAAAEPDAAGARLTDELNRALGMLLQCQHMIMLKPLAETW